MKKGQRRKLCEYQHHFEGHLVNDINQFLADSGVEAELGLRLVCETLRSVLCRTRIELSNLLEFDEEDEDDL